MSDGVSTDTGIQVPVIADLSAWSDLAWSDGVQLEQLDPLETLVVRTRNSTYEIVVVNPHSAEVLVRGGRFFPVYTPVVLSGASLGGSFLKLHGIYGGFSMELHTGEETIITSAVKRVSVAREHRPPS